MRIDIHAHYFPVEYLDRLDHHAGTNASQFFRIAELASEGFSGIEKNIRNMAFANVYLQVFSVSDHLPYFPNENASLTSTTSPYHFYAPLFRHQPATFSP